MPENVREEVEVRENGVFWSAAPACEVTVDGVLSWQGRNDAESPSDRTAMRFAGVTLGATRRL
jgi:hypothetical protein